MNIGTIFGQMLVLFAMILIGCFAYRKDWINDDASQRLSKLVVNVFNPVLVVNGVLDQESRNGSSGLASNIMFVVLYFIILILVSNLILFLLRPKSGTKSVYRLMTVFSNIGFMGIPVIQSIYGNAAMIYVAFYILGYNLMLYTYGMHLARRSMVEYTGASEKKTDWKTSLKKLINPGVVAAFLAVVIFASGISLPAPVHTFCSYVGNTTIPLSMILIGVSVAQADIKQMLGDWRIYLFILLRMVLLPVALIFLLKGLAVDAIVFGVFIIEMGMPVGSIIALMVKENGGDVAYCTKGVVLSMLASMVTIPVICMFFEIL